MDIGSAARETRTFAYTNTLKLCAWVVDGCQALFLQPGREGAALLLDHCRAAHGARSGLGRP
ncbi:MAG: hypothetical protein ACK559_20545, partial [bacterium]